MGCWGWGEEVGWSESGRRSGRHGASGPTPKPGMCRDGAFLAHEKTSIQEHARQRLSVRRRASSLENASRA